MAAVDDGLEALSQLNRVMPDVIVSDLNMPRMSGFDLLAVVRRCFPGIVTVAMSGAYRNSEELPPEVIADGFYAKGEHPESLFETLTQLLSTTLALKRLTLIGDQPAWTPCSGNDCLRKTSQAWR